MSESRTPAHRPASSGSRAPADGPRVAHDTRGGRHGTGAAAHEVDHRVADPGRPAPPVRRRAGERGARPPGRFRAPAHPPHHADAGGAGRIPATAYATARATPPTVSRGRDEAAAVPDRLRPLAPGHLPRSPRRPRADAPPSVPRCGTPAAKH
ncbi:hypothetical protein [Streptomyces tagetis]|uniref:Uncharacterized protein n=1 Tax=Streptomyces tagetis TaxID=2820809 RepID=A0A940XFV5_9ACTN|nr:hypothetical protein [Streptomyces sp. RG38]MBQ0825861.1 hypothetical protein [Streptomyces sp. RG38]